MTFSSKLCLLFTTLLLSSIGNAAGTPANVDVQYFPNVNCGGSPTSMTLTRGPTESSDSCYYTGVCAPVPSGTTFESFRVSRIAIQYGVGAEAQCTVFTYSDASCSNVIQGASSAGPLYFGTNYPTGCLNELSGTSTVTAAAFKLVCGVASQ